MLSALLRAGRSLTAGLSGLSTADSILMSARHRTRTGCVEKREVAQRCFWDPHRQNSLETLSFVPMVLHVSPPVQEQRRTWLPCISSKSNSGHARAATARHHTRWAMVRDGLLRRTERGRDGVHEEARAAMAVPLPGMPTTKRRDARDHAPAVQRAGCEKGDRYAVTCRTPQGSPSRVSLHPPWAAQPCGARAAFQRTGGPEVREDAGGRWRRPRGRCRDQREERSGSDGNPQRDFAG